MRNAFPIISSRTFAQLLWASIALMEIQHVVEGGSHEISVEKRSAWTTSRIMGSPEPPLPYITEPVFPSLKFQQCLELTAIPGSNRLLVVEQAGKVFTFPNQPDIATADLVVNFGLCAK